jgi:hypothetical protein
MKKLIESPRPFQLIIMLVIADPKDVASELENEDDIWLSTWNVNKRSISRMAVEENLRGSCMAANGTVRKYLLWISPDSPVNELVFHELSHAIFKFIKCIGINEPNSNEFFAYLMGHMAAQFLLKD